ncbi:PaaI family thioesterase [Variovorax terrae]|uniref:PaaI family thioesterase n=1 Tax=Variovorax terrae TaxID=2923278 RepID=A0A9X2AM26_9BURK|nr:PaaI family thioesterase [Variovorax terrae]MCJ0763278.1 PaaI family thioesterase [Variovorax terrae]
MDYPSHIPFVHAQGIELVASADGQSELRLKVRPDQENHLHLAHGGVIMTLLDVAMAQAARSSNGGASVITIEMKTTFFQPSLGVLTARGTLLHRTGRMAFAEATVFDAEGRRCAQASGTFRYVSATPKTSGD